MSDQVNQPRLHLVSSDPNEQPSAMLAAHYRRRSAFYKELGSLPASEENIRDRRLAVSQDGANESDELTYPLNPIEE